MMNMTMMVVMIMMMIIITVLLLGLGWCYDDVYVYVYVDDDVDDDDDDDDGFAMFYLWSQRSGFPTAKPGLDQSMELEFRVSQLHSHRYEIQFQQSLLRQE